MRREEMNRLCEAVAHGESRLVEHQNLFYTGRVLACHEERLAVDSFGHSFEWDAALCREVDERGNPLGPPSNA